VTFVRRVSELQVLSDIHLEFGRKANGFGFPVTAPNLCLLGDIGDPGTKVYRNFLHAQAKRFEQVFVLKGNHSCYGRTLEEADALITEVCAAYPDKLNFLNRTAIDLDDDHVILGCTLWSHVLDGQRLTVMSMLADHKHIQGWSVDRNNEVHAAELAWLQEEIAKVEAAEKLAIVLTHHAPSFNRTAAPEHKNSALSSAFCTDLEYMCKLPVVLWMFGHTHYSSDQRINGVRVCSNQAGYPGEGVRWNPGFKVQLEF